MSSGVKTIVLYEGRHTALSLMEKAGVPISIVSKWAGHHDTAFTYSTYVHASDDDLETGTDALGKIYKLKQAVQMFVRNCETKRPRTAERASSRYPESPPRLLCGCSGDPVMRPRAWVS